MESGSGRRRKIKPRGVPGSASRVTRPYAVSWPENRSSSRTHVKETGSTNNAITEAKHVSPRANTDSSSSISSSSTSASNRRVPQVAAKMAGGEIPPDGEELCSAPAAKREDTPYKNVPETSSKNYTLESHEKNEQTSTESVEMADKLRTSADVEKGGHNSVQDQTTNSSQTLKSGPTPDLSVSSRRNLGKSSMETQSNHGTSVTSSPCPKTEVALEVDTPENPQMLSKRSCVERNSTEKGVLSEEGSKSEDTGTDVETPNHSRKRQKRVNGATEPSLAITEPIDETPSHTESNPAIAARKSTKPLQKPPRVEMPKSEKELQCDDFPAEPPGAVSKEVKCNLVRDRRKLGISRSPSPYQMDRTPLPLVRPAKQKSEGDGAKHYIHVGEKYQVPYTPTFFLAAPDCLNHPTAELCNTPSMCGRIYNESNNSLSSSRKEYLSAACLMYSPYLHAQMKQRRIREGTPHKVVNSEEEMTKFVESVASNWKKRAGWQPYSPEYAYKLLHAAQYDPYRALWLMNRPSFDFEHVCDPPTRKYENKWKPTDRRGLIPMSPFPLANPTRASVCRRQMATGYLLR